MKALVVVLGLLIGGYMLADGIVVMVKGKYIGPAKPGPWSVLFERLGIDVFRLGPLFILFGLLWLGWTVGLIATQSWVFAFGVLICLATLWYVPLGSLLSLIVLAILVFAGQRLGIR